VLDFDVDGKDGGHFSQFPAEHKIDSQEVPVVRLVPYLDGRIDMLKLDIEGAEVEVLLDASDHLDKVHHLFVEYHSYPKREQQLSELLEVLQEADFRYHLKPGVFSPRPFMEMSTYNGKDNNINIFAYR
jgi:hypothetical protein